MKQIYLILIIIIVATLTTAIYIFKPEQQPQSAALTINDKVITKSELEKKMARKTYDMDSAGYLSALINRELLIQEARRLRIDTEEPFRQSLEAFYEQSLIEALLKRKIEDYQITIADKHLQRFQALMGKTLTVTKFDADSLIKANDGIYFREENLTISFEELSNIAQYLLVITAKDKPTPPFEIDGQWMRLQLLKAKGDPVPELTGPVKTQIKTELAESAKMIAQTQWILELRQNAKIEILMDTQKTDPQTKADGS